MNAPTPNPTFICSSCQSPFDWAPLFYHGLGYCCAGCAAGGPCCCSYDGNRGDVVPSDVPLEMVAREWARLTFEADRLRCGLAQAIERRQIEFGAPRDEGSESIPIWQIEAEQRRLAIVETILRRATVVEPGDRPVIGAIITAQASTGETEQFRIVAPGAADSTLGCVAYDSPFGQLLTRTEVGSSFVVKVPHGARRITVVDISYPAEASTAVVAASSPS
jgi:transcription elongation GreA/GreB family factor